MTGSPSAKENLRPPKYSAKSSTQINLPGTYDIFISHSWRYDQEWTDMVALLDGVLGRKWRNWSLPWYDPGLDRFTPQGHAELVDILDGQLSQCGALLVLADICKGNRGSTWLGIEIELAKKYRKPIFGIAGNHDGAFPEQFRKDVLAVVKWSAKDIVGLLKPL
jgi:hypothetical protein